MKIPKAHVAILHYTALPIVGGVENVIAEHAHLLHAAGHSVTLITGRGGDDPALADARVLSVPELDSEYPDNLKIAALLEQSLITADFATLQTRIEELLAPIAAEADVLIVHNALNYHFNLPLTAALSHLLARGALPPTIAWCHDISRYANPSSGTALRSGFPWDLLRNPQDGITYVAVSKRRQHMLAQTLGCVPEKIRVIPNGVTPETLWGLGDFGRRVLRDFDLLDRDLIMLMPIRITRAKNIEFALRVTSALKAFGLSPLLLVSGPPDPHDPEGEAYADELCRLRNELGLEHEAAFLYDTHRSLTPSSVAELYRMADIVFLPSHREGFGLPVLEGGLVGKAVFASEIPAVDEVGADLVRRIAQDASPEDVAAQMVKFTQDSYSFRLSWRVRKQFSWQGIFERAIEPLITELTS